MRRWCSNLICVVFLVHHFITFVAPAEVFTPVVNVENAEECARGAGLLQTRSGRLEPDVFLHLSADIDGDDSSTNNVTVRNGLADLLPQPETKPARSDDSPKNQTPADNAAQDSAPRDEVPAGVNASLGNNTASEDNNTKGRESADSDASAGQVLQDEGTQNESPEDGAANDEADGHDNETSSTAITRQGEVPMDNVSRAADVEGDKGDSSKEKADTGEEAIGSAADGDAVVGEATEGEAADSEADDSETAEDVAGRGEGGEEEEGDAVKSKSRMRPPRVDSSTPKGEAPTEADASATLRLELRLSPSVSDINSSTLGPLPAFVDSLVRALCRSANLPRERMRFLSVRGEYIEFDMLQFGDPAAVEARLLEGVRLQKQGPAAMAEGGAEDGDNHREVTPVSRGTADGFNTVVDLEILPGKTSRDRTAGQDFNRLRSQFTDVGSWLLRKSEVASLLLGSSLVLGGPPRETARAAISGAVVGDRGEIEERGSTRTGRRFPSLIVVLGLVLLAFHLGA